MGVTVIPDHIVRSWGIRGIVIRDVPRNSAAERAGLRGTRLDRRGRVLSADVVTAIDGQEIDGFADLANALDGRKAGDTILLTVVRGDEVLPIELTLQALER